MQISEIWIYPVKSLGGIQQSWATIGDRGFHRDRRWMIIDPAGKFVSQREVPACVFIELSQFENEYFVMTDRRDDSCIDLPFFIGAGRAREVKVWRSQVEAIEAPAAQNQWLSERLDTPVKLVYMPDQTHRAINESVYDGDQGVSFADGYPYLLIGQSSLDDLNHRLETPVPMTRFRPNLVFSGGSPYCEDEFHSLTIGKSAFIAPKLCARCVMTTIDDAANKHKEPLATLAQYRQQPGGVMFGTNLVHEPSAIGGAIRLGDRVAVR